MTGEVRVALVTGGERGLGHEIGRQLCARGIEVVVGAREIELAQEAADSFIAAGGQARAVALDVTDDGSVQQLAHAMMERPQRLDILVNNAGILLDAAADTALGADLDIIRTTLETNLFGAWRVAIALVPLMRQGHYGRIVNVSSTMGQLETMGFDSPGYRLSKAALNALTCMLAAETSGENILVNAVEPGWTRTAMGGPDAPRSVQEGAATPVWLATLPDGGISGGFFFDRRLVPW